MAPAPTTSALVTPERVRRHGAAGHPCTSVLAGGAVLALVGIVLPTQAPALRLVAAAAFLLAAVAVALATARARAAAARLDALLAASPLAVVELDEHGIVRDWSRGAEHLLGWSRDEAVGRRLPLTAAGQDPGHLLARVLGEAPLAGYELTVSRRDRAPFPATLHTAPLGAGRLLVVGDASECRKLEERLVHAAKMEAVGRLASGIAHDFSNLVLVIRGQAWLIRENIGAAVETEVAAIDRASEDATRIIRHLLAFGRKGERMPEVFDVSDVLADVGTMIGPLLGASFELVRSSGSQPATVQADRTQVELIVLNLVLNARDAQPDGGLISLETAIVERAGVRYVELSVADTGRGMDEETRSRIFEPFFTTKGGRGTGLGLSIVRDLVDENGGLVEVESDPGEGTTFRIQLPCARPAAFESEGGQEPGAHPEAILFVSEDEALHDALGRPLERYGYRVVAAANVPAARALAGRGGADVVVVDVGGTGDVGEPWAAPGMPVVYLFDDAEAAVAAGVSADSCLVLPCTPTLLASTIRAALGRARAGAPAFVPEPSRELAHTVR